VNWDSAIWDSASWEDTRLNGPFKRAVRTGAKKHPFERPVQTARIGL